MNELCFTCPLYYIGILACGITALGSLGLCACFAEDKVLWKQAAISGLVALLAMYGFGLLFQAHNIHNEHHYQARKAAEAKGDS